MKFFLFFFCYFFSNETSKQNLAKTLGFVHEWCHDVVLVQLDFIGFRKLLIEIESLEHSYNIEQMSIVMVKNVQ